MADHGANMRDINDRRVALITKDQEEGLTSIERIELARLRAFWSEYIDLAYPLPDMPAEIERMLGDTPEGAEP